MLAKQLSQAEGLLSSATILIVDDEFINRTIAAENLTNLYQIRQASSGEEALELCLNDPPDLILLDVVMGEMSGLQLCEILKNNEKTHHIPVIFVTATSSLQEEENLCWEAGGVDVVAKPFNGQTLRNRVKVHLMLKFQQDLLRKLTFVDGLTGLYNRHMLDEALPANLREVIRSDKPCSLLIIDVDWFKQFNDAYGHLEGDETLKLVGRTIKECLKRPTDLAFRFGGEEFLGVLPNTNSAGAEVIAQEIIEQVEKLAILHKDSPIKRVTISIGIYTVESSEASNEQSVLLERADQALYQAKSAGRNRFCLYNSKFIDSKR